MTTVFKHMRRVTEPQKEQYENMRMALLIPDPWHDKMCKKVHLPEMYIESTIAELLRLRAELEPGVKLNCPNPLYEMYHDYLMESLQNKCITHLQDFLQDKILLRPLEIMAWEDYTPDLRVLDTIDEAISWLDHYLRT